MKHSKYIVYRIDFRTDGTKAEVGIQEVTDKVKIVELEESCETCEHFGNNIKQCLLVKCKYTPAKEVTDD